MKPDNLEDGVIGDLLPRKGDRKIKDLLLQKEDIVHVISMPYEKTGNLEAKASGGVFGDYSVI